MRIMKVQMIQDNSLLSEEVAKKPIVQKLLNRSLANLDQENFIIFPHQLADSEDLNNDNYIFQSSNNQVRSCNIAGIISDKNEELRINSRFTNQRTQEDYFLRYMLQKVLNYNVVANFLNSADAMSYYDLLVFLFPYYLNQALSKGMYKEYIQRSYNDANVRGTIDLAQHIKQNVPFTGRIAYHTSEFSFDNQLTQLMRHTIEYIQSEYQFLLKEKSEIKENVLWIKRSTFTYSRLDRSKIIQKNLLKPVKHSYYEEYSALQRLCLQILTRKNVGFGTDSQQVHGIIIDIAWLWEEYIWKITGWNHYGRKKKLLTLNLFDNPKHSPRYPDFSWHGIPIDTKYKRNLDTRNDYNQITTYIHIMQAAQGGFLQPTTSANSYSKRIGNLAGGGEAVFTYKFAIPQQAKTYSEFIEKIQENEKALKKLVSNKSGLNQF